MRDAERNAAEATRLLNEPLLVEALAKIRQRALEELCVADASNAADIMRLQAIANCVDAIRDQLNAFITASGQRDGGTVVEVKPSA